MKRVLPILAFIVLFGSRMYSQCNVSPLTSKSNWSEKVHVTKNESKSTLYRIKYFEFTSQLVFDSKNISKADNLIFEVLKGDVCNENYKVLKTFKIDENVNIDINEEFDELFLRISGENNSGKAFFNFYWDYLTPIDGCYEYKNLFRDKSNPILIKNTSIGIKSINSCTKKCQPFELFDQIEKKTVEVPVQWIDFEVHKEAAFLNIKLTTESIKKTGIVVYGKSQNIELYLGQLHDFKSLDYINVNNYSSILIGVFDKSGEEFEFQLDLEQLRFKNDCINFFEEKGDSLYVKATSLGSPLEGPYKPNEKIDFVYKILNWAPVNRNWLHGVNVELEGHWADNSVVDSLNNAITYIGMRLKSGFFEKEFFDDEENEIDIKTELTDISNIIKWEDYWDPNFDTIPTLNELKLYTWYFNNETKGPIGSFSNFLWGKEFQYVKGSFEEPLFEIHFSVFTKDTIENCDERNFCSIKVTPYSDNETGSYPIRGCKNMPGYESTFEVKCCDKEPAFFNTSPIVCDSELLDIKMPSSGSYSLNIEGPGEYNEKRIKSIPEYLTNDTDSLKTYIFTFISNDTSCIDTTFETKVIVAPKPKLVNVEDKLICKNQILDINLDSELINENQVFWSSNSVFHQRNFIQNRLSQRFKIYESDSIQYLVTNEFECSDSTSFYIQLREDCVNTEESVNKSFIVSYAPNPTSGYLQINAEGLEKSNATLNLFNASMQLVYSTVISSGISIIDIGHLDAGLYYARVINNDEVSLERVTLITK